MKLKEALLLDRNNRAKARVQLGYVYAMGCSDGDEIFVQYRSDLSPKPRITGYKLLTPLSNTVHQFYLTADWAPISPMHPLEALAKQAEEGRSGTES